MIVLSDYTAARILDQYPHLGPDKVALLGALSQLQLEREEEHLRGDSVMFVQFLPRYVLHVPFEAAVAFGVQEDIPLVPDPETGVVAAHVLGVKRD